MVSEPLRLKISLGVSTLSIISSQMLDFCHRSTSAIEWAVSTVCLALFSRMRGDNPLIATAYTIKIVPNICAGSASLLKIEYNLIDLFRQKVSL